MKSISFCLAIALCYFCSETASAQINPRSFCGTLTVATRANELSRARGTCERATARMALLEERRVARDAKDDQSLVNLNALYGTRITTCAQSFTGQGTPTSACAGLAERELVRAERWAREYVRLTLRKQLRASELDADLYEASQSCAYVTQLEQVIAWRTAVCN